jgi:hypothetical protein
MLVDAWRHEEKLIESAVSDAGQRNILAWEQTGTRLEQQTGEQTRKMVVCCGPAVTG